MATPAFTGSARYVQEDIANQTTTAVMDTLVLARNVLKGEREVEVDLGVAINLEVEVQVKVEVGVVVVLVEGMEEVKEKTTLVN